MVKSNTGDKRKEGRGENHLGLGGSRKCGLASSDARIQGKQGEIVKSNTGDKRKEGGENHLRLGGSRKCKLATSETRLRGSRGRSWKA